MMVVFMAMFVLVRVVVTMVVIVYVVMLMVMDVVMYVEMGDGVPMPMIVFMVIMVMIAVVVMIVVVMIVVMVVVVVVPFLLAVDGHRHVGARDAAGHRRLRRHVDAGETQAVHLLQEGGLLLLAQKLKEGSGKHVASAPHGTFNVKGFHITSPPVLPFD